MQLRRKTFGKQFDNSVYINTLSIQMTCTFSIWELCVLLLLAHSNRAERHALPGNGLDDKDCLASNRLFDINSSLCDREKSVTMNS